MTVNYDETDPTAAAQQIQTWLNSFTPVTGVERRDACDRQRHRSPHVRRRLRCGHRGPGPVDAAAVPQSVARESRNRPDGLSCRRCAVTNLDRPFTINNIPVSPTNPDLTAEAIASYFQPPSVRAPRRSRRSLFRLPTRLRACQHDGPLYRAGRDQRPDQLDPLDLRHGPARDRREWRVEFDPVRHHLQRLCQRRPGDTGESSPGRPSMPRWSSPIASAPAAPSLSSAPLNAEGCALQPGGFRASGQDSQAERKRVRGQSAAADQHLHAEHSGPQQHSRPWPWTARAIS